MKGFQGLMALSVLSLLPLPAVGQGDSPEAVARGFYAAYEQRDMNALRALFASEAQVIRFRVERDGDTKIDKDDALKWVSREERDFEQVTALAISLGEANTLIVDIGASVSIEVHTQRMDDGDAVTSTGISTFSMAQLGGRWRIMQLSTFEREE